MGPVRHHGVIRLGPLTRVKPSCGGHRQRTGFDPTETLAARDLCGAHCRTAHHFPLARYAVLHSTYQELAEQALELTGEPQELPPKVERR